MFIYAIKRLCSTSAWCCLLNWSFSLNTDWYDSLLVCTWCWHLTLDFLLLWLQLPCGEGKQLTAVCRPAETSPLWSLMTLWSAPTLPSPGPQQLWFLQECVVGARLSMKAMHQNAFAVALITRRCLRNNRLDWISHPFFSTLIHLAVSWSHWQPNACDWRVRGGGGGQKKRGKSRGERTSLKDEAGVWKSGWLK